MSKKKGNKKSESEVLEIIEKNDGASGIPILKSRVPEVLRRLKSLNKKLVKKQLPEMIIKKGKPYLDEILVDIPSEYGGGFKKIKVYFVDITITHNIKVLKEKGFDFVGTVTLKSGVKTIFNNTKDVTLFDREIDYKHCDHCNTKRYRNTISFFRKTKGKDKVCE